ncbi:hypothetical protein [Coprobacter sp.]
MTQGFFAHRICYKHRIYRQHILFLNESNQISGIEPFSNETANTTFHDGILIVSSSAFHLHLNEFLHTLKEQLEEPGISVLQAIIGNPVYNNHIPDIQTPCSLYNISDICWKNERPASIIKLDTILH